jgi:hypothetical protein
MKKLIILTLTVLMTVSIASFAVAAGNGAGLLNSPHDFSATIPALGGEICRICHSPHDHHVAGQNYLNGLLWNKTQTTATYTMYDQAAWPTYSSLDGTVSAQPDGTAKLCLSCHDGTVAVDSFENHAPAGFTLPQYAEIPGFADGANRDLRGTHPISITYEAALDGWLKPDTAPMGGSGTIADVLDNNKVQCASCHDVHDAPIESVAGTPLLRVTNAGSAICLACHIK